MSRRFPVLLAVMIALWVAGAAVLVRAVDKPSVPEGCCWTAYRPHPIPEGQTEVPDVDGLDFVEAGEKLCDAGLGVSEFRSREFEGVPSPPRAYGTRPPVAALVPIGTKVVVLVAVPPDQIFVALPGTCP